MKLSETTTRVLVAAVGVPLGAAVIYFGGWALAVLLAFIAVAAALEFYRLAAQKGVRSFRWIGAAVSGLFIILAAADPSQGPEGSGFATAIIAAVLLSSVAGIWLRGVAGQPLLATTTTVTGAVYTGALLSFGLFLRHLPGHDGALHGTALLFAPVLLTWASDTFAYFVGRAWGTRKLIPSVSPGKTLQGAVGALVGTMAVAVGYSYVLDAFPVYQITVLEALVFGLVISLSAQLGDLAESLFKRDAGVKDSGTLLPGHGGALDRFDSLFFTLPLGYFFFRFIITAAPPF
jgi:phosphatidate cytidylyltransferase